MDRLGANSFIERNLMDILKPTPRRKFCQAVYEQYGIPIDRTMDIVMFKRPVEECSNFEAFVLVNVLSKDAVSTYFSEEEIETASSMKYEEQKAEFPLVFEKMCEIAHDQWIGRISIKELIKLRDARMINYKEGQQRVLKRVISGGIETFHINISRKSVNEIEELLRDGLYISDDITLNMPEGSQFTYNARSQKLVIESLPDEMFDIIDGYHRYIAISNVFNQDPDFNYPMEIRITSFQEEKVQQFIYQKDQKNRMSKGQRETFNQNAVENRIINMVNQDPNCLLYGKIGRADQMINMAQMAPIVKKFFVPPHRKKSDEPQIALNAKAEIVPGVNTTLEQWPEVLAKKWNIKEIFSVLYVISNKDVPPERYGEFARRLTERFSSAEKYFIVAGYVRVKTINEANEMVANWLANSLGGQDNV